MLNVPLYRRRIVITRPRVRASEWVRAFATAGADVIPFPTFEVALPERDACREIVDRLRRAASVDDRWIAVTSPTSAEHLLNISEREATGESILEGFRVAAVGDGTRKILLDRGLTIDLTASTANAVGLAESLMESGVGSGSLVFHVSSSRGRPELVERLHEAGADAESLHVGWHRPIEGVDTTRLERESAREPIDLFTFASPSSAENLLDIASHRFRETILATPSLAVGSTTSAALTDLGFRTITTASSPRVESVVGAAIDFFAAPPTS